MPKLIKADRSIIPACDVYTLEKLEEIIIATAEIAGIGGYKVGFTLAILFGLPKVVETIRKHTMRPIIYDHQKGGTDIPEMGEKFARAVLITGVNAVILFPLSGPTTANVWIRECQNAGLTVLIGGHMTHSNFLKTGNEDGFIGPSAPEKMYEIGLRNGITDFVVPGNNPFYVGRYRTFIEKYLGEGSFALYAPGFISQGGDISAAGKEAGKCWHAIVGRALYAQESVEKIREVAKRLTSQIQVKEV